MKLTKGQIAVLRYCCEHEAVMILNTAGNSFRSRTFWEGLPGAGPATFHSLVRRGLLRVENRHFHFITSEGREALDALVRK